MAVTASQRPEGTEVSANDAGWTLSYPGGEAVPATRRPRGTGMPLPAVASIARCFVQSVSNARFAIARACALSNRRPLEA